MMLWLPLEEGSKAPAGMQSLCASSMRLGPGFGWTSDGLSWPHTATSLVKYSPSPCGVAFAPRSILAGGLRGYGYRLGWCPL